MSDPAGDPATQLVNTVFQRGGAEPMASAGASKAVEAHGSWFARVAAASAGAINASLVADGMKGDDVVRDRRLDDLVTEWRQR